MEYEIALTSIFILVLVVTATAKSALDELSDVGLRLLASEGNGSRHTEFWRSIVVHYQQFRFTLTFGIHVSIASIAILISSISNQLYPQHFLAVSFAGMILTVILFRQILPMIATQNDPARTLLKLRFPLQLLWLVLGFVASVIYVRDLLKYWQLGETDRRCVDIARSTYFVPETKPIDELLPEMQKAKTPMAIVINEYGGLAGLVTIEDLVEEIVGEIEDEDEPETGADEADIVEEAEGVVARGHVEVGKIERRFDVELAADDFTTVAGLVINELGHLPAVGEEITFRGLRFKVVEADERRVSRVRIQKPGQAQDEKADVAEVSTAARAETKRNFMFLM